MFQRGKAMLRPISRIAKMVSVLATAQRQPARTAPDDQVRGLADVDAHLTGAADESGQTPAREKHADNHQERNDERRDAEFDQFRGSFRGAQPCARAEAAEDSDKLQFAETRGLDGGRKHIWGRVFHAGLSESNGAPQVRQATRWPGPRNAHPSESWSTRRRIVARSFHQT